MCSGSVVLLTSLRLYTLTCRPPHDPLQRFSQPSSDLFVLLYPPFATHSVGDLPGVIAMAPLSCRYTTLSYVCTRGDSTGVSCVA
ncbi:hypothetical protein EDB84DRAFT_1480855 [Lactarius hengduanensis]|nr:hypothetical protein EDB84DRAFT_1480855 [Lactarius hengduanensis]